MSNLNKDDVATTTEEWQDVTLEYDEGSENDDTLPRMDDDESLSLEGNVCNAKKKPQGEKTMEKLESLLLNESAPDENVTSDQESTEDDGSDVDEENSESEESNESESEEEEESDDDEESDFTPIQVSVLMPFWKKPASVNNDCSSETLLESLRKGIETDDGQALQVLSNEEHQLVVSAEGVQLRLQYDSSAPVKDTDPSLSVCVASGSELRHFLRESLSGKTSTPGLSGLPPSALNLDNHPQFSSRADFQAAWYLLARTAQGEVLSAGYTDPAALLSDLLLVARGWPSAAPSGGCSRTWCAVLALAFALPLLLCLSGLGTGTPWRLGTGHPDPWLQQAHALELAQCCTVAVVSLLLVHGLAAKNPLPLAAVVVALLLVGHFHPECLDGRPFFGDRRTRAVHRAPQLTAEGAKELGECQTTLAVMEEILGSTTDKYKTLLQHHEAVTEKQDEYLKRQGESNQRVKRLKSKVEVKQKTIDGLASRLESALELCGSWCSDV